MARKISLGLFLFLLATSCTKVDVTFGNENVEGDPNVSYFDDYSVQLATYKIDSFVTSADTIFTIGHHLDTAFGSLTAGSFAEINLPVENPVRNKNVFFDSLVVILKPNGDFYGDTLAPFKVTIHRLLETIGNEDQSNTDFYNPRKFSFEPAPIGQTTVTVRPKRGAAVRIRLSDAIGQDLLKKFKNNDDSIRSQSNFLRYFKGLYLGTDTLFSKTLYYFNSEPGGLIMRLYYRLQGATIENNILDFTFNSTKQFNYINYYAATSNLSAFTPFKTQLKKSNLTGNKAYLHSNIGCYIKVSFPTILNLKELHPYIKVLKAELAIKPNISTYRYPYRLPGSLHLYASDDNNRLNGLVDTSALTIDALYGERTEYSFDITEFIAQLISEGRFSETALMLTPSVLISDSRLERLIINDQTVDKDIQLRLYVLGL